MNDLSEHTFKRVLESVKEIKLQAYQFGNVVKESGEQEINLFGEVYITFRIDCYAEMERVDDEEDQGFTSGWFLPDNHNVQINFIKGITIWVNDSVEAVLSESQENKLNKKIINNLKFNTVLS